MSAAKENKRGYRLTFSHCVGSAKSKAALTPALRRVSLVKSKQAERNYGEHERTKERARGHPSIHRVGEKVHLIIETLRRVIFRAEPVACTISGGAAESSVFKCYAYQVLLLRNLEKIACV